LKKFLDLCDRYKMLNCIPCYENTKGQAEGSGF